MGLFSSKFELTDGKYNGVFDYYSETGKLYISSNYLNGLLEGEYKVIRPSGKLQEKRFYIKGVEQK